MATTAFSKNRLFGMQFHAAHIAVGVCAILAYPHIAGGDAFDRAIVIIQHLGGWKARVNFNTKRLGLFTKPATKIAKRNNIVAMIIHAWRGRHTDR